MNLLSIVMQTIGGFIAGAGAATFSSAVLKGAPKVIKPGAVNKVMMAVGESVIVGLIAAAAKRQAEKEIGEMFADEVSPEEPKNV